MIGVAAVMPGPVGATVTGPALVAAVRVPVVGVVVVGVKVTVIAQVAAGVIAAEQVLLVSVNAGLFEWRRR